MDKELREVLEEIAINAHSRGVNGNITVIDGKELDQAHSAITKLFNEEMLRLIGKNKKMPKETDECKYAEQTANELRAELRKKVGEI